MVMTRVNETMSQWLATICGRSTENFFDLATKETKGRRYPWAVSIMLDGKNKLGGTIISPYHILTAAHGFVSFATFDQNPCVIRRYRRPGEIRQRVVAIGSNCVRGYSPSLPNHPDCNKTDVTYAKIKTVYVDSDFVLRGCAGGHDWAIVELKNPLTFDSKIQPICLPFLNQGVNDGLTVVSWGKRNIFDDAGPLLHKIPMQHNPSCTPPWSDEMPTNLPDYVCAKAIDPSNPDSPRTCHGDSGAGLEQRDYYGIATLVGITSFGSRGCPPNELARFTRLSRYLHDICYSTGVCYTVHQE
ncbi:hypothetical protein FO519_007879 [Halicephalobus sp. NKZ332]|nr:hypothetical protein FO519_007879 [Halicephalobus sp. NKZ332]